MALSRAALFRLSRDPRVLFRLALGIAALSGIIGLAIGAWAKHRNPLLGMMEQSMAAASRTAWRTLVRDEAGNDTPTFREARREAVRSLIANELVDPGEAWLAQRYADAALGEGTTAATALAELSARAQSDAPPPGVNHVVGDIHAAAGRLPEAMAAFEREARLHSSLEARQRLLALATDREDHAKLRQILTEPALSDGLSPEETTRARGLVGDWQGLVLGSLRQQWRQITAVQPLVLSLLCATLWVTMIASAAGVRPREALRLTPAVLLGAVAFALVTALAAAAPVPFDPDGPLPQRALHEFIGVALRQESLKLFCCIPLLVALRRCEWDGTVLLATSLVGLGFSISEKLSIAAGAPAFEWHSFVQSHFAHMAWTGLAGHALWAALRNRRHGWETLGGIFLLCVVAHGLIGVLSGTVITGEPTSYFGGMVFILSAYQYFHALRLHATPRGQTVSPLAVFVVGSALLLGLSFIFTAATFGPRLGIQFWIPGFVVTAPLAFLFIREFRDS